VRLALPRTTIWSWIADLPVPRAEFDPRPADNARRRAAEANSRKYRLLREAAYERGAAEFEALAQDLLFRDFVCLYIAEGYKLDRNVVSVSNADPAVIVLCAQVLRRVTDRELHCSIQYHADQSADALADFWGDLLNIDPAGVRRQRKSNSGQMKGRTWRSKHGVAQLEVYETLLRARLQAWMECVQRSWA
jgi:hypothetical protein